MVLCAFNQLEQGVAVLGLELGTAAGEHQRVGGHLAVVAHAREGQPENRVEPMDDLQEGEQRVVVEIGAAQMGQLVKQDKAQFIGVEAVGEIEGQEKFGRQRP